MRLLISFIFIVSCMISKSQTKKPIRYISLGDSYTIGTDAKVLLQQTDFTPRPKNMQNGKSLFYPKRLFYYQRDNL
jgi:hypothetical protein